MKKENLISVVVPVFNVEQYLKECIESIIRQTYSNLEIILVDDGSTDESGKLCEKYALMDKRILVIHKENGGLISARKAGVKVASGEFVSFVDGDDWIEEDLYEKVNAGIADKLCDVFCYGFKKDVGRGQDYEIITNRAPSGIYIDEKIRKELFSELICGVNDLRGAIMSSVCCKVFRKEILYDTLLEMREDFSFGEDFICSLSCILSADIIVINNDIFGYRYRFNNSSIMNTYDKSFYERSLILYSEMDRVTETKGTKELQEQAEKYKIYILISGITNVIGGKNKFLFWRQYQYFKKLNESASIRNLISKYEPCQIPFGKKEKKLYDSLKNRKLVKMIFWGMLPCIG